MIESTIVTIALTAAAVFTIAAALTHPWLLRRFAPPATAETLAVIRIVVASAALLFIIPVPFSSTLTLFSGPGYEEGFFTDMGVLEYLFETAFYQAFIANELALYVFKWATVASLLMVLAGYQTRTFVSISIVLFAIFLGSLNRNGHFSHFGLQTLLLMGVLLWVPSNKAYACDVRKPTSADTQGELGAAQYLVWVVLTVPYVFAVLSKLRNVGLDWVSADNIRGHLYVGGYVDAYSWQSDVLAWSVGLPDIFFVGLGIATIAIQLTYPLILFLRSARIVLPTLVILMHLGIYLFMDIFFIDLIVLQLILFAALVLSHIHDTEAVQFTMGQRTRRKYALLIFLFLIAPALSFVFQIKYFPFTNWDVYANESGYVDNKTIQHTLLSLVHADTTRTRISVNSLKHTLGLRTYPRHVCYRQNSVIEHYSSCKTFLTRATERLNETVYQHDPVVGIEMHFWKWSPQELQQHGYMRSGTPSSVISFTPHE